MKITKITTTVLHDPDGFVVQDATTPPVDPSAKGRSQLFVHIHTDEGTVGLGMAPGQRAIREVIHQNLDGVLVGQDPFMIEKLWQDMYWRVRGFGRKGIAFQAIAAIDIALWDLKGKVLDQPIYRLLGPAHESVPIYGSGGWTNYSQDELVAEQVGYVERGIPRVKMKVGKDFGQSEREDIERLKAVRKAVGDDVEIFVDANNGYYAKQAIKMSKIFEDYDVAWFEEPVLADDIPGLAQIAQATTIPVATGEHEYTKYGFRDLLTAGAADIVQPDIYRVSGITEWMKVSAMSDAFNLPVAPHAVSLVSVHCAMATPNIKVVEVLGAEEHSNRVWWTETPPYDGGTWKPFADRPGLGLELNPDALKNNVID
ncbi:MAG: mandelate racemase/muconate lactonizing enzyme family protein [Chloroflexota bacterium]|jgi:L-alanine-DL-glutamate epimerase-like enolase superfamily enzyme|nr:mandelate racemase/muconate lactonizing enzyme family protein [Chloroflexota bacterium]